MRGVMCYLTPWSLVMDDELRFKFTDIFFLFQIHGRYMSMRWIKPTLSSIEVLQFWKKNEKDLPLLANLARIYLAVPPSSVPSERLFKVAKP